MSAIPNYKVISDFEVAYKLQDFNYEIHHDE